jgi:hypothetical protein
LVNRPITEQLKLWESIDVDVWQSAHVKTIRLPEKLSSLRQKLYHKAKQEIGHLRQRSQRPFRPAKGRSYYRHLKQLGLIYL